MLKVQTHFFQYKVAEIQVKQYGTTDFKTLRLSNIQTFWNLIPLFNLLISWLPNIVEKIFGIPDEGMDSTFPMSYSQRNEAKTAAQVKWGCFYIILYFSRTSRLFPWAPSSLSLDQRGWDTIIWQRDQQIICTTLWLSVKMAQENPTFKLGNIVQGMFSIASH